MAEIGELKAEPTDIFTLKVSDDSEYQMIIPRWHNAILKKMIPVILFSILTLLLLGLTFIYLIRILRKQRELEEIKTDFTNNITHELRTPIAVAYAANDALLNFDSANHSPRVIKYLNICQSQLRLLDRLVEQILSLSMERTRPSLLNIEDVDVKEIFKDLSKTFKFKYPNKVTFLIDTGEGVILRTDRMHLSNIISNLVDNAIKYSVGEACVTMRAYREKNGGCIIEISDNGIGISDEQQKHIFDKFYRVPHGNIHNVKGYGLGLFYVKSMTEKLGASVSVKSALGKGSCFKLIFMEDAGNE